MLFFFQFTVTLPFTTHVLATYGNLKPAALKQVFVLFFVMVGQTLYINQRNGCDKENNDQVQLITPDFKRL